MNEEPCTPATGIRAAAPRRARRSAFLLSSLAFLSCAITLAQSGPLPSLDPNDQSGPGAGAGSVDTYNGQLTLSVPIGPVYQVGPGLAYQLRLSYSSRVWEPGQWALFGSQYEPHMLLRGDPALGVGWRFSLGQIFENSTGVPLAYVDPAGAAHRLYNRRVFTDAPDPTFFYTRDGSFLRVKYLGATTGYELWAPNGTKTTFGNKVTGQDNLPGNYVSDFGRGRNGWHATRIENTYGSAITVTYQTAYPWVPATIAIPSINGTGSRTLTVTMAGGRIASFTVPTAAAGGDATYTLTHTTGFSLPRPYPHPDASATTPRLLTQIALPTVDYSSNYQFTYYDSTAAQSLYGRGAMKTQKIPTGATFTYQYGTWTWYHANPLNRPSACGYPLSPYPTGRATFKTGPGFEPSNVPHPSNCTAPDRAAGIVQRTVDYTTHNATASSVTKWFQWDYPDGESGAEMFAETQTLVLSPGDAAGHQHSTTYLFTASSPQAIAGPFVAALQRVGVFDNNLGGTSTSAAPSTTTAQRVQRLIYEADAYDTNPVNQSSEAFDANRRVMTSIVMYNSAPPTQLTGSGKYHQIQYSQYNPTAGHYGREEHSGTISATPATDARVIDTTWTPTITTTDWILDLPQQLTLKPTAAGAAFSTVTNTFDANGGVTASSILDGSGSGAGTYQHTTPRDTDGFPTSEQFILGTSTYTRDNLTFKAGTLATLSWSGLSWDAVNNEIDSDTGLVTKTTAPNGLDTDFTYDKLGHLKTITPPGNDAPTTLTYALTSNTPKVTSVTQSGGAEYDWEETTMDTLGRPVRIRRHAPAGTSSDGSVKKIIRYDPQGNTIEESEWLPNLASEATLPGTEFSNFDNFGRARTITTADTKSTTIDYADGGSNPASVWRQSVTIGNLGGSTANTVYVSDAFGNLTKVTEQGPVDTTYTYNLQDRLTKVTQSSGVTQNREYTWDAFGFLRKEKIPERSNLDVTYTYDALGNLLSASNPGNTSVQRSFTYDTAGRLKEALSAGQQYLKNEYDSLGSCSGDCPVLGPYAVGQLFRRTGYNPTANPVVTNTEEFTYADPGGRLSRKKDADDAGVLCAGR